MSVVIDASVAVKWVLDEPGSEQAAELRSEELLAPSLWLAEAANVLWSRTRSGEISAAEAAERLARLMDAPVATTPIEADIIAAHRLANGLSHPVYDCLYLALALREDTHLITADGRFVDAVDRDATLRGSVRRLGD
ncbi:MAG TPA: type II toxin-antitoxin system VapC family toxin [Caulobacteraceae bacterium]|nr:type II toxin-antitoxin system VapC family toxin [Caulobacteraceae bacterium]